MNASQQHERIERELRTWAAEDPFLRTLGSLMGREYRGRQAFLVGGSLRDRVLRKQAKDFDLVLDVPSKAALFEGRLPNARENFFGGISFEVDGRSVDMWPLRETYHIKRFEMPPTVLSLLAGAPFNLDKIAFELASGRLYDDGCLDGIASRQIMYAPAESYLEHVQAARCVLLKRKTEFSLHETAIRLLSRAATALRADDNVVHEVHDFLARADGLDVGSRREVLSEISSFARRSTEQPAQRDLQA